MKIVVSVLGAFLAVSMPVVAETKGNDGVVVTSMDTIADKQSLPCSTQLRQLAGSSLKRNPHRMLAYKEESDDIHLFNALAVTHYRDRESHISFHGVRNVEGTCDTSVTESYVLQTSCADARHEAFSKWVFQGKLDKNTMVLTSKRVQGKQAFLTDQFAQFCLVTTRLLVQNP